MRTLDNYSSTSLIQYQINVLQFCRKDLHSSITVNRKTTFGKIWFRSNLYRTSICSRSGEEVVCSLHRTPFTREQKNFRMEKSQPLEKKSKEWISDSDCWIKSSMKRSSRTKAVRIKVWFFIHASTNKSSHFRCLSDRIGDSTVLICPIRENECSTIGV